MATHEQNEFFAHFADSAALCRLAKYFSVLGGLNADCRLCDTQSPRATTICRGCTAADLIRDIGGILLLVPSGDLRHKRLYSTGKFGLQWDLGGDLAPAQALQIAWSGLLTLQVARSFD
ncbi:hypothetical protein PG1C_13740 [Rugosibacter aromaticivorans]|uniref:Uncharacterized protein n=1 Tax=Rugosibacter aromaticivorans TaxID=1565605 RepID=A0A0C5JBT4_9PROT|nr:hypothetical protein [Rugosibacter aromaticivorans]AJP49204.1 hypothetical protein PG1C_13740 [Rugosibacter aromaticivorans]TBR15587.1 MAG: hypothetical protein EPO43_03720 [Rugosibacter sp.]